MYRHLGRKISYEEEKDITSKISECLHILEILKNVMKPNSEQTESRLKVCNILGIPPLLYGCEIWTLKQGDVRRLQDSRDEIHETHSRTQFIRPQKK
jgi:hypothetical protein